MRGPPMPPNSMPRRRAFSAAMRCAASRSPDASPATMPTRRMVSTLADDSALRAGQEPQYLAHLRAVARLRLELGARLLQREAAPVERAVGALQRVDRLGREAP